MAKRTSQELPTHQQQPYDNLLKSLLEGQEKQMLPYFLPGAEYSGNVKRRSHSTTSTSRPGLSRQV